MSRYITSCKEDERIRAPIIDKRNESQQTFGEVLAKLNQHDELVEQLKIVTDFLFLFESNIERWDDGPTEVQNELREKTTPLIDAARALIKKAEEDTDVKDL